jgi:hypothetical protein
LVVFAARMAVVLAKVDFKLEALEVVRGPDNSVSL